MHKQFIKSVIILMLLLSFNFFSWQLSRLAVIRNAKDDFADQSHFLEKLIESRIDALVDNLDHGRRFYNASASVDRNEFRDFLNLEEESSKMNIEGMLYVEKVKQKDLASFVSRVQKDKSISPYGYPFFNAQLGPSREEYYIANYFEPGDSYKRIFGYDIGLDPELLSYFEAAKKAGKAIATSEIEFFNAKRILAIEPVYDPSRLREESSLKGFIVMVLKPDSLFDGLLNDKVELTYTVSDNSIPFYKDSSERSSDAKKEDLLTQTSTVRFLDREWQVSVSSNPKGNATLVEQNLSDMLFISTTALIFLLFASMSASIQTRKETG